MYRSYANENDAFSSGVLNVTPRDFQTFAPEPFNGVDITRRRKYNTINFSFFLHTYSNVPIVPLGDFSGNHIGYKRVTETKPGNGKTVYEFYQENPNGFDDIVYAHYPTVPVPPRVKTGLENHSTSFDKMGVQVSKSSNESNVNYGQVGYAFRPQIIRTRVQAVLTLVSAYPLVKPDFVRTTRQTVIKDGVTTVTENEYNNWDISVPTKTKTTNSDAVVTELEYKYPRDFFIPGTNASMPTLPSYPYFCMVFYNLTTIPIEIYRKINGTIVEGSKLEFSKDIFQNSGALSNISTPMPWKSYMWKRGINPGWQLTGEIKEYWSNGTLKKFQATGSTVAMEYSWNKGVLTQKKWGTLVSNFSYIGNNSALLQMITDENGLKTKFYYDGLQRLVKTENRMKEDGTDVQATTEYAYQYKNANNPYNFLRTTANKFQEKLTYDLRGNIETLQRKGLNGGSWTSNGFTAATYGLIDHLSYAYSTGNRLSQVTESSLPNKGFKYQHTRTAPLDADYRYDANGNLIWDRHKNITSIEYNYLNLPLKIVITKPNEVEKSGSIEFVYDATGVKLRKIVKNHDGTVRETRDYVNGVEYKDRALERVAHSEGAVVRNDFGQYQHEYVLRDHLGNTRVTFRDGTNKGLPEYGWGLSSPVIPDPGYNDGVVTKDDIVQINHYYPFGLNMEGDWNGSQGKNKYQYNEKEWNDDFGLGMNDYGARFYDPAIARWSSVDPLAEKYAPINPYAYVANNPIIFIDPNGMELFVKVGNKQAIDDIWAMVGDYLNDKDKKGNFSMKFEKKDRKGYLQVSVDADEDAKTSDGNISLLSALSEAKESYLYEVADEAVGTDRISNTDIKFSLGRTSQALASCALNLSIQAREDETSKSGEAQSYPFFNSKPKNGFDGHIILSTSISSMYYESPDGNEKKDVPRTVLAFHEMTENYYRTTLHKGFERSHKGAKALESTNPNAKKASGYLKNGEPTMYRRKQTR